MRKHLPSAVLPGLFALLVFASCTRGADRNADRNADQGTTRNAAAAPVRIASMAPACTSILVRLGLAGNLVAVDTWSDSVPGVPAGATRFDMMKPDAERMAELEPDLVLVSSLTREGTDRDPFKSLSDAGAKVVYIPTSDSLQGIRDDIMRIAGLAGKTAEGKKIVEAFNTDIESVESVAKKIPAGKKRTVIFEIAAAPSIYSFGSGVYLDELLSAAGAVNALAGQKGWIAVNAETVLESDPDVILTNTSYLDDPVAEIKARPGWDKLKAVAGGRVFRIDADSSSRPGPDVTKALREIAKAVYPEYF